MSQRYLIVADPLDTLMPEFDLGVCVATELIDRGIPVDYLDLLSTDPALPSETYLSTLPVRQILASDSALQPYWELGPERIVPVTDYGVLLQRKDPPVDDRFIAYCRQFAEAPGAIVQVNNPSWTWRLSEHILATEYPDFAAPTWVCSSFETFQAAVRAQPLEAVAKPENLYCGIGVEFFAPDTPAPVLQAYWEQWQPTVIVQPYLEEIERSGDLRILVMNGTVLGSVLRVPAQGSRLANLHAGGSAARLDPTARQLEACRVVAEDLTPKGLYLLGLDFIGEHLTEVNITSPTTIVQINQVMGIRADRVLVDELEALRRARFGS
jgi:glutathione synthase